MTSELGGFPESYSHETWALFSTELTRVPLLWNHPKTAEVGQALLPVRFPGIRKGCSNQDRILILRPRGSEATSSCEVTFVVALP